MTAAEHGPFRLSASDFDPLLTERGARALHAYVCGTDYDEFKNRCLMADADDMTCCEVDLTGHAGAVLSAVAEPLRAEGAAEMKAERDAIVRALRETVDAVNAALKKRDWAVVHGQEYLTQAEDAYQRGMVEGARQVLAAVEKVWSDGAVLNKGGMELLTAAREAVAKIEKGGAS